ncbi:MAG: DUF2007 domain-containing protein [Flavobacteriales bacterium]|nr:DUF2007 domain-containing protein [Flavobacteriales bacterium]
MSDKRLITFRVFDNIIDAHIIGAKLESEGIECYYIGENMTSLYPVFNSAVAGVQLQIKHEDLINAQAVLLP